MLRALPMSSNLFPKVALHAQAVLVALAACPKDADVQRWGCQALVPLFGDSVVAAPFRQAGVTAVIRALAVLQDVETALKGMGALGAPSMASIGRGVSDNTPPNAKGSREKWVRAMKKVTNALGFSLREHGDI